MNTSSTSERERIWKKLSSLDGLFAWLHRSSVLPPSFPQSNAVLVLTHGQARRGEVGGKSSSALFSLTNFFLPSTHSRLMRACIFRWWSIKPQESIVYTHRGAGGSTRLNASHRGVRRKGGGGGIMTFSSPSSLHPLTKGRWLNTCVLAYACTRTWMRMGSP